MRRSTATLLTAILALGAMAVVAPVYSDCPITVEAAVREHASFTFEATILDREHVTVTVTNIGEDELILPVQDWSLRIGYESSAAIPTSVPARRAHKIVLDPISVGPGEAYSDEFTMRSHRTRMGILDLVPAEAACDEVIWVRLTYALELGEETVKGAANIKVAFVSE